METSYERGFLLNSKKILAAAVSVAAIASLTACGGVKDDTAAGADSGNAITIGTTDKITSLDPAGSYDNGSYAVQIQVFPFLYAQDYNTSELSPDIAADDGTWNDDGTEFTVKLKDGLKLCQRQRPDRFRRQVLLRSPSRRSTTRTARAPCSPTSNP